MSGRPEEQGGRGQKRVIWEYETQGARATSVVMGRASVDNENDYMGVGQFLHGETLNGHGARGIPPRSGGTCD
eukprot:8210724-Pyramimonas_sp.AAC.1